MRAATRLIQNRRLITATNPSYSRRSDIPHHIFLQTQSQNEKDDDNSNKYTLNHVNTQESQLIQRRYYHTTPHNEKAMSIVMGLGAVALTAKAGQYTVQAFQEWQKNRPVVEEEPEQESKEEQPKEEPKTETEGKRQNIFEKWFSFSVGSKYYEGGFEDKMTKREAALVLGVRESSSVKRIKESHRKILMLNHPDQGGSNYLASKINEAKELLLKGKE